MSGRNEVKSGCVFLCVDVLCRNCIVNVFAGGVVLRFIAAASTISVTLSRGDYLSWKKPVSGIRGCMSNGSIVGDCIATLITVRGLSCSSAGDCENTGGDLFTSHLAGADEVLAVISTCWD